MFRRWALAAAAVCVVLAMGPATGRTHPASDGFAVSSAGSADAALPGRGQTPPTISRPDLINPAHAIVDLRWLAGVGSLVLAAMLLLLWAYRRRLFILEWAISWTRWQQA